MKSSKTWTILLGSYINSVGDISSFKKKRVGGVEIQMKEKTSNDETLLQDRGSVCSLLSLQAQSLW